MTQPKTYSDAGVDIDAGNRATAKIKELARKTFNERTLSEIGSFGGMFDGAFPEMRQPVLVASADGVGTKLKIAFLTGVHHTIGGDLVNHCVNDILVQGARPLFFLDYIATGKLSPETVASIVAGMANGCRENGCVLLGGETAEMPGFYADGEYDVAGFIVGVVDREKVIDGKRIMAGCAEQVKRVTLELGGKSANIIFADADLEKAASAAPGGVFDNSGQDCCARSRVLVQRSVFDRFLELFVAAAGDWKVGDPMAADTAMGPLVTAQHLARVRSFTDGLDTVFTGKAPTGPGYWHPIMIATPSDPTVSVCRDEIFGPVAVVLPFDDEADAIRICNDSDYGLSGSVWTGDGAKALRVVRAMEAGAISVNSNSSVRYSTPFGGFKQSGLGREHSMHVLDHYTELKNVFIAT